MPLEFVDKNTDNANNSRYQVSASTKGLIVDDWDWATWTEAMDQDRCNY
jgi:hypothetical protein